MVNGWSEGAVIGPTIPRRKKHYDILRTTGARMNGGVVNGWSEGVVI